MLVAEPQGSGQVLAYYGIKSPRFRAVHQNQVFTVAGRASVIAQLQTFRTGANLCPMNVDWLSRLEKALLGRRGEIARRAHDWVFTLAGGGSIALPIPWRIVADGRIAFANQDVGQQFGLPAPVDGEARANDLIASLSITSLSIDTQTADLVIHFGDAVRLDAFNNSSGYEGWHISLPLKEGRMSVVAMGGGDLAIY